MITGYKIEKENQEDVLYLYLDYNYEFGQWHQDNTTFLETIQDYIQNHKIKFKGHKMILVVAGIGIALLSSQPIDENHISFVNPKMMEIFQEEENNLVQEVKTDIPEEPTIIKSNPEIQKETVNNIEENKVNIRNTQESKTNIKENTSNIKENITKEVEVIKEETTQNNEPMVTLYRSNGTIEEIALEEYLIGVLGAEIPASFHSEALKAQAVVARTYALKRMEDGKILTDTVSTQAYKDSSQLKTLWGTDYNKYYTKIKNAVDSTKGMVILYQGKFIDAVFHSTSNGYTVDSIDVWGNQIPYLKSVESPYDLEASSYLRETIKDFSEITQKLGITVTNDSTIEIKSKDEIGRVQTIEVDGKVFHGVEFRNLLGLRSTDFDIEKKEDSLLFITRGFGHGVGMSQYGANGMANHGISWQEIIKHYYTNVTIEKIKP